MSPLIPASLLVLLLALPSWAQVPDGIWTAWSDINANAHTCGYLADGTPLGQLPFTPATTVPIVGLPIFASFPQNVSKHPAGFVITSDHLGVTVYAGGTIVTSFPINPVFGTASSFLISPLGQHSVLPGGDLWIATGTTPAAITRFSVTGSVLQTVNLPVIPGLLAADTTGGCWVSTFGGDRVTRIDAAGIVAVPPTATGGFVKGIGIAPSGLLWVLSQATALGQPAVLRALDSSGTTVVNALVPGGITMGLDACGRPHVLRASGAGSGFAQLTAIDVHDPATGIVVGSRSLVGFPSAATGGQGDEGLVVDAQGNCFVRNAGASVIDVVAPDGTLLSSIPWCGAGIQGSVFDMNGNGDPTGVRLASVVDPSGDSDGDGIPNDHEIARGSNPFDATSVPAAVVPLTAPAPGLPLTVAVNLPADAGLPYLFGLSASAGSIPLLPGDCRSVPLAPDALFLAWFNGLGAAIPGAFGTVSPTGAAQTTFNLPSSPLGGTPVTFALVTVETSGLTFRTVTDPLTLTLP